MQWHPRCPAVRKIDLTAAFPSDARTSRCLKTLVDRNERTGTTFLAVIGACAHKLAVLI
jgi:hypothetical protein